MAEDSMTPVRMEIRERAFKYLCSLFVLPILLTAMVLTVGLEVSTADTGSNIDGTVTAGSVDNRISISITNPSAETSIDNAELEVREIGQWIRNVRIEQDGEGPIAPRSTRRFRVTFDVAADAEKDAIDRVTLRLAAEGALVDHPTPTIVVKIDRPKDVSEAEKVSAPPLLKLLRIDGENIPGGGYEYTPGQPGFSRRGDKYYREGTLQYSFVESVKFASLPSEIVLGEAFEVAVEARKGVAFADCGVSAGGLGGKLTVGYLLAEFRSKGKFAAPRCGQDDPREWARRGYTGPVGGDTAGLRLRLIPQEVDERDVHERRYAYRTEVSGNDDITVRASGSGILYTWNRQLKTTSQGLVASNTEVPRDAMLRVTVDLGTAGRNVVAVYGPVHSPDEGLDGVPVYSHPAASISGSGDIRTNGETVSPVPAEDSDSGAESDRDILTGADTGQDGGMRPSDVGGEGVRGGPIDPNSVDPRNVEVSRLIREWIITARPPEDVVHGNSVRYSGKGNIIGTVSGGSIESRHEDGRVDPVYLWQNKRRLDSVDHCTLEEYVVAGLSQESIQQCAGRYRAVKDLTGLSVEAARTTLTGAGLEYSIVSGSPAENPQEEGAVERQEPTPGTVIEGGDTVTLWVYSNGMDDRGVPEVVGLPAGQAKMHIENAGLRAELQLEGTPPTRALAGTVNGQRPVAGSRISPGSAVSISVYGPYSETVSVPKLVGFTLADAKKSVKNIGLELQPALIGPAPEPGKALQVAEQQPEPATALETGSPIRVRVWGEYVAPSSEPPDRDQGMTGGSRIPNVTGLTLQEAKTILQRVGLDIKPTLSGPAPKRAKAFKIKSQNPRSGATAPAGTVVSVDIWSDYIDQRSAGNQRGPCDCDLVGRWKHERTVVEFRRSGRDYLGRIIELDNLLLRWGYRIGEVLYKVRKTGAHRWEGHWLNRPPYGKAKWQPLYIVVDTDPMILKCCRMRFHASSEVLTSDKPFDRLR